MSLYQIDYSVTILPRTKEKAKHFQTSREAKITELRNGYIFEPTALPSVFWSGKKKALED